MTLNVQRLSADVSVAPQLGPEAMAEAAAAGFRSVINNRPDFEGGPTQPTSASIEEAARAAGLEYAFLPVAPGHHSEDEIARFGELIAAMPGPVLVFCRSGARSSRLYQAATGRP
ncbi:MAG: TIGR01244 family sulfur transferase [Caldimonas sp.]